MMWVAIFKASSDLLYLMILIFRLPKILTRFNKSMKDALSNPMGKRIDQDDALIISFVAPCLQ